jgi:alginate O-acetyltransferase complex protein AlgI
MIFSSYEFLFAFLPFALLLLNSTKNRPNLFNLVTTVLSLYFYARGEKYYVLILIISSLIDYYVGAKIEQATNQDERKKYLKLSIISNLLILIVFKYTDFIITQINSVSGLTDLNFSLPLSHIPLPLGISFFTFQSMSYSIDIYRGEVKASRSFRDFLMYVSMFPQLVAGPIVRYIDVEAQIQNKKFNVTSGIERFVIGLAKKVIIADLASFYADLFFGAPAQNLTFVAAWMGIIAYSVQIYFDFSGYSDMAIGLGRILGFDFPENFNHPYSARSIQDFWRRWHISLSTWFRDYLYIPLGGNKRGKFRTYLNQIIVFFLCGLWHGASWNFVIWGLFHGFWLTVEKAFTNKLFFLKHAIFAHYYTLIMVIIGWVFFRANDLSQSLFFLNTMFDISQFNFTQLSTISPEFIVMLLLAIPFATSRPYKVYKILPSPIKNIALCLLFILSISLLSVQSFSPFIYFRF